MAAPENVTIFKGGAEPQGGQPLEVRPVDHVGHAEAIQIGWPGETTGHLYAQGLLPVVVSALAKEGGVLSMTLRIDERPMAEVFAEMACGIECSGDVPLGKVLRRLLVGKRANVKVDLGCFEKAGARLNELHTPFRLYTQRRATLNLSVVRFERIEAARADLSRAR